ncbi:MAG: hypothetical protein EZS28_006506 [Streblomastix strix]|uniref:Uncharacterized protein n=1 Tax=Streblomastix strix TaxID=222440 RepID=A0A5J4WSQ2_9EUKA|nr:MAG: hypothetical protein EZS28_006506 [Streblomastix strix]
MSKENSNFRKVSTRKKGPFHTAPQERIEELLLGQAAEVDSWDIANKLGKLTENILSNLVRKVIDELKKGGLLILHSNTIAKMCHASEAIVSRINHEDETKTNEIKDIKAGRGQRKFNIVICYLRVDRLQSFINCRTPFNCKIVVQY